MKYTFKSDDCMIITIPLGSLRDAQEGQLMPEKFHCVFKDAYKVFLKGQPKALGAAQLIAGILVFTLGMLVVQRSYEISFYTVPSVLFVVSGILSYGAGHSPNMCVAKLSFSLNIISFLWSVGAVAICAMDISAESHNVLVGVMGMIAALLVAEMVIALVLIYWLSKAICRPHFNTLPIIMLKQEVRI